MIEQLIYVLLMIALCWIPIILFFPILRIKDNLPQNVTARNTVLFIDILPNLGNSTGIIAQELYEAKFKHNIINTVRLLFGSDTLERDMEILGHEITVQFFPEEKQYEKRIEHAKALCKYYPAFKGWSFETVYECMKDETSYAMVWIEDNIEHITKLEKEYYDKTQG